MERHTMELMLSGGVRDTQFQITGSWVVVGTRARYAGRVVPIGIGPLYFSPATLGVAESVGVCTKI